MTKSNVVDWGEAIAGNFPPLDFIMDGLLAGTVGGIIAPGGAGKSFFGMQLCASLSTKDLMGLGIQPSDVKSLYITAEDPLEILYQRAHSLTKFLDSSDRERLKQYVDLASIHGKTPVLLDSKGNRVETWIDTLKKAAEGRRLIVIDTLRKFHQGEENDSGHMTVLTQILDEIASETGAAVLFLHHANKASTFTGGSAEQGSSRGSSALVDNIRFQLNLVKMTEDEASNYGIIEDERSRYIKVVGSKANYREDNQDHWLRRSEGGILITAHFDPQKKERSQPKRGGFAGRSGAAS